MVILVSGANTVDDCHTLGHSLTVPQDNLAIGRPRGIDHAFELQAGEYVFQSAVAILGDTLDIEEIIPGSQDDIADFNFENFVFLFEVDGIRIGGAEDLAGFAFALQEIGAVFFVDDGVFGHCLGEGSVNHLAFAHTDLEDIVNYFDGAFFDADATSGAVFFNYIASFLADSCGEVAQVTI